MYGKVSKNIIRRWEELKCSNWSANYPLQNYRVNDPIYYLGTSE